MEISRVYINVTNPCQPEDAGDRVFRVNRGDGHDEERMGQALTLALTLSKRVVKGSKPNHYDWTCNVDGDEVSFDFVGNID